MSWNAEQFEFSPLFLFNSFNHSPTRRRKKKECFCPSSCLWFLLLVVIMSLRLEADWIIRKNYDCSFIPSPPYTISCRARSVPGIASSPPDLRNKSLRKVSPQEAAVASNTVLCTEQHGALKLWISPALLH